LIIIIDTGTGNLASIKNMLHRCGIDSKIAKSPEEASKASSLILPGVGAFDNAMQVLNSKGWTGFIRNSVLDKEIPILGICLGMQLLTRSSEEGTMEGLGVVDADTKRFNETEMIDTRLIPHMGWNLISKKKDEGFFEFENEEERFYFVHSYHVVCDNKDDILTTTNYGYEFVSSFKRGNVTGVQFHPEKSHKFGFNFFKNYFLREGQ